jgi:pimeloyl-ACP methyl ester carboxylesterase
MKRKLLLGLTGLITVILITIGVVLGPYLLRVQHFPADVDKRYYADFYLYISPEAQREANTGQSVTILVQPNNSGTNSDDPEVHRQDAWWTGFGRHRLADELGVVLLVPAFLRPGEEWWIYTHALDRDVLTTKRVDLARLDLQLLAMVDAARASLAVAGILTEEKFLIQGYSASGMFANRFTVLHPDRVKAVAVGSPGGWPVVPLAEFEGERLDYPIGIADLETLTGHPFNLNGFNQVPQLIIMGSLDDNDSLDFKDGWDPEMARVVDRKFGDNPLARWDEAEALYHLAGANAEFILVDGVGHDRRKLQSYTTDFFSRILNQ